MQIRHNRMFSSAWAGRFPVLTTVTLALTAAVTATRFNGPGVVDALQRDPEGLGSGELWRLLSPVLVQTDNSAVVVLVTFAGCAVIGAFAEQWFTRRQWIALYLVGALIGHGIGEVFQPHQGGTSVAFAALLGGLAALALRRGARVPTPIRVEAALAIPIAIAGTWLRDIHGLPFLAGLALAIYWHTRERARPSQEAQPVRCPTVQDPDAEPRVIQSITGRIQMGGISAPDVRSLYKPPANSCPRQWETV